MKSAPWAVAALVLGGAVALAACTAAAAPPNVVVILADDAGWGDFSFVGNPNLATPAIDGLARDGAVFERFFVQPVCAPTRAELLTGRSHPRSGVRGVSLGQERMAADERTLAEIFRDSGYATGCFGKWHNGTQWPYHPRARGFDTFYGFTEGHWNAYHDAEMEHDGRFVRGSGYIADDLTGRAVDFIRDRAGEQRPFFCYLALNTPHSPMDVPDDDWARFREAPIGLRGSKGPDEDIAFTRAALAMVENLDRNVGRLLAALAAAGVADDTILVFFSDNGPNSPRWCGGFRGHKGSTDEGGVRSVCCVRFPARIRAGTKVPAIAGAIDLLPTLAGLAGIGVGATKPLDGLDLSPVLVAGPAAEDVARQAAGRTIAASFGGRVSVRSQAHRLDDKGRLYDIDADPGHSHDLAAELPDEAARLREAAARWRRDVLEAVPKPPEERFPVGAPGAPLTELPARDGLPHGGVARSSPAPNASFFTNWTTVDDSITWTVDVLKAGRYEATLWYTCPAADAGSTVQLACGQSSTEATIAPGWDPPPSKNRDRVPRRGEGIDKEFRPLALGAIDLTAGPAMLALRATQIPGRSVADVRRLVLVPVAAGEATPGNAKAADRLPFTSDRAGGERRSQRQPNIIVVLADDLGYSDLGCFGATSIRTPHLDRMASEGLRLTSFCVAQAVCTASRAALMTGCYPNRIGMAGALNHTSTTGIHPAEQLLPALLRKAGYATAAFGKWHLGLQPPFWPTRRGFDAFFGIPYSNDNGPLHPTVRGMPPLPFYDGDKIAELDPDQSRFTRRFTDRAVDFIVRNREQPFFLYLPHVMPHVPIFASEAWRGRSAGGLYGDVVEELDGSIGEILAAVDREGLADKTLVVFASDNGPFLSYGDHAGSARPFREGKLTAYEGGVRVPCIVRWPGTVPAGGSSDALVTAMDLFATLVGVAAAEPPRQQTDGVDVLPLLRGAAGARGRETFWYYSGDELHAVRAGPWKLHLPHDYLTVPAVAGSGGKPANFGKMQPLSMGESGIRGVASRHGYEVATQPQALYHLGDDPGESRDVSAAHPDVVERLERVADAARADLGDALIGMKGPGVRPVGDVRTIAPGTSAPGTSP